MNYQEKDFCFCTLALGYRYRLMAKQLAEDLDKYSPGTFLIIYTDQPNDFKDSKNIIAFKHHQKGILHCYNDKRLVLEQALLKFNIAIYIDSDTTIVENIPNNIQCSTGIAGLSKNMITHVSRYRPKDVDKIINIANKIGVLPQDVNWIGESLFMISRDGNKGKEFLEMWGLVASYLELKGMHSGEGTAMGLAAAKVGWQVETNDSWESLKRSTQHLDASQQRSKGSFGHSLKRRLGYHYRLNKARLIALKNFDFYYR